ncbi:muscle, skeletal receptor tyrosine protein kinase-like isoform X2 [Acanthaster planci]|uniref:receptor protein-tyrosine kinase n=1 Tax=Acanthaster planci TaxID=133434 RepID=A0A8B7XRR3_ACAPL|nr:muscle, skeletal receptor tyrosine protein kinase-like isoform X2 [Acanthaster planci]
MDAFTFFRSSMAQLAVNDVLLLLWCFFCSVSAWTVTLSDETHNVYYEEDSEARFTCAVTLEEPKKCRFYATWYYEHGILRDRSLMNMTESSLNTTLSRENLKLTCSVHTGRGEQKNASLDVTVLYPPSSITIEMDSQQLTDNDTATVMIGRPYRFTCNASGLNPANHMMWFIKTQNGVKQAEPCWNSSRQDKDRHKDRDVSCQLDLNITKYHNRVVCRALYPDGKPCKDITVNLLIQHEHPETTTQDLETLSPTRSHISVIIPTTSSVVICVTIAIVFLLLRWHRKYALNEDPAPTGAALSTSNRSRHDYNFPRGKITLLEVLGSGNFGQVYHATADGIYQSGRKSDVAVKILKRSADADVVEDFKKEIAIQKDFTRHPNIASMLGYCMEREPFYLIMEYLPRGNLQKYLRGRKDAWRDNTTEGDIPACPFQLLTFASQVAFGMDFLSTMGCIHRDLATRNVLLSEDLVCKLSDFGLARDVSETEQYEKTSLVQ